MWKLQKAKLMKRESRMVVTRGRSGEGVVVVCVCE